MRLTEFYQRFFDAQWTEYDGNPWLCQSVELLRIRLAKIQHKSSDKRLTPDNGLAQ